VAPQSEGNGTEMEQARLDELTPAHFRERLGERFTVAGAASADQQQAAPAPAGAELELVAVEPLMPHPHRAEPFSLTFRGPRQAALGQSLQRLEHPQLGVLELFLVPIGGTAATIDYEAIFN
jgi:hypothetical protein